MIDRVNVLKAVYQHAAGKIAKHKMNVNIIAQNPVGIGEHGDIISEIESELEQISKYHDQVEVLKEYFGVNK